MKAVLVALLVAATVGVASASAATSLTVNPSPVTRGTTFTLSGCGFPTTPTSISFKVVGPGQLYFTSGEPLSSPTGCMSENWLAWWPQAGAYEITGYYRDSKGATHKVGVVKFDVL
jgi:hypothetical protein